METVYGAVLLFGYILTSFSFATGINLFITDMALSLTVGCYVSLQIAQVSCHLEKTLFRLRFDGQQQQTMFVMYPLCLSLVYGKNDYILRWAFLASALLLDTALVVVGCWTTHFLIISFITLYTSLIFSWLFKEWRYHGGLGD